MWRRAVSRCIRSSAVKDGNISGYVKPMFSDLKVYDYQKDKNKGLIGQTKQILIGTAAHIFKNRQTQKVATQVTISGSLKKRRRQHLGGIRRDRGKRLRQDDTARLRSRSSQRLGRKRWRLTHSYRRLLIFFSSKGRCA